MRKNVLFIGQPCKNPFLILGLVLYIASSTDADNIATSATASATSVNGSLPASRVNDGSASTDYMSADNPAFPQYVTLNWSSGQSFNTVSLKCFYSQGSAPTNWDIEVSADGSTNWTNATSSGTVVWSNNDATVETKTVSFTSVTNKKGVRIK